MLTARKKTARTASRPDIPAGLERATQWSWRVLVVGAAVALVLFLVAQLAFIVVPLLVAVLLTALAAPLAILFRKLRFPRWLATIATVVLFLGSIVGLFWIVVAEFTRDWPSLVRRSVVAYQDFVVFLLDSPLQVTETQINQWINQAMLELDIDSAWILSGALSLTSSLGSWLVGFGIAIFALIFFIHDGPRIWEYVVSWLPKNSQPAVLGASRAGWDTVLSFVRVQVFVAFVDALGIGLGALFLGLPLVFPIAVAVFLGGFVPFIGATVTGIVVILIALIYQGPTAALIMAIIVLVVQQVESQILQPIIMGPAVRVHPLAVVISVAAGGYLAGIPGVLFAVPVVAFANVSARYLAAGEWQGDPQARPRTRTPVVR
jgi:predicted PurR-regulated permease PerM